MSNRITIKLHFDGGPLDGSVRPQQIPADWRTIRYEHCPRTDAIASHIYSGDREPADQAVRLHYLGAQRAESTS